MCPRKALFLAAAGVLAVCDQATKLAAMHTLSSRPEGEAVRLIRGILYLKPTTNTGGIWGLFGDAPPWIFALLSLLAIAYLIILIVRIDARDHGYLPSLALLLGGFAGNGLDRILNGQVTDFIYVTAYPKWIISTFNLADVVILIGIAWLVGRYLLQRIGRTRAKECGT